MSYGEVRDFLAKHTQLIELSNASARVAIAPEFQGRVMTSSCDGLDGMSFGFVNRDFIAAGNRNEHFNNYGGEERVWISPEGGQFSLWFKPGIQKQTLADWYTPAELNDGPWPVVAQNDNTSVSMAAGMKLQNTSGTRFDIEVDREVRLLDTADCNVIFGQSAGELITQNGIKFVAYQTTNKITNRGPAMNKEKGLISIWMLGMLNASPESVVLVPYKSGDESKLGPVVQSDYFGRVPADRLKVLPEAVLFRADGQYRSKIGTSQRRARDIVGSIDFSTGVLTVVKFSLPENPVDNLYMSNLWELPLAEPYVGDVMNSYNDGPAEPGQKQMGSFYELESLSPAKELKTGESISHKNLSMHIKADQDSLTKLAKEIFGVNLATVREQMF